MTGIWALAALWLGLALIASLVSIWLRISTALSEISGWHDRPAHHRRGDRLGDSRHRRDLDQISVGPRRHRPDLPRRRRARSRRVQTQMERGCRRRPCELPLPVSRLRCRRLLHSRLGRHAELACGRRHVHHLGGGRLRRDARVRLQHHRVRQDGACRLLRHRSRHGGGARADLRALHLQDADLPRCRRRGLRPLAFRDASFLRPLRQPALRA